MFVDEVIIEVYGGDGGDGCLAFRREKFVEMGGPFGGSGGRGSNIVFKVEEGLKTLIDLRYNKVIKGSKGTNGLGKGKQGANAEDVRVSLRRVCGADEFPEILFPKQHGLVKQADSNRHFQ